MCEFKPGDEVIYVGNDGDQTGAPPMGWEGVVTEVCPSPDPQWPDVICISVSTWPLERGAYFNANAWRPAKKRGVRHLLADGVRHEEPRRAPAKKRVRA